MKKEKVWLGSSFARLAERHAAEVTSLKRFHDGEVTQLKDRPKIDIAAIKEEMKENLEKNPLREVRRLKLL